MFDPTTHVAGGRSWSLIRHDGCDYHRDVPLRIRLNPFRYQLNIGKPPRFRINRDGAAHMWISNLAWRLWGRRLWERNNTR